MEDLPRPAPLTALLEDARRQLVETGTRNRLIHVNRAAKRANARDEAEGGETDGHEAEEPMLALGLDEAPDGVDHAACYRDLLLETRLGPEVLRTAEEEQGVNIPYLAMGFLF